METDAKKISLFPKLPLKAREKIGIKTIKIISTDNVICLCLKSNRECSAFSYSVFFEKKEPEKQISISGMLIIKELTHPIKK
jgi:hypothetical protein